MVFGGVSGAQDGQNSQNSQNTQAPAAPRQAEGLPPEFLAADADPLELARAVARHGDGAIIEALGGAAADRAFLAIQSTPHLAEPEGALPVLAAIAVGRDPDLAPAAALAALRVAEGLTASSLVIREVSAEDLRGATELFEAAADDETARRDIRQAAHLVVARLRDLSAPTNP
ncbi:MAG: hypothetical protein JRH11_01760 [Deltaproteobacteria bacterium]|nr:hypothetical protein [Deltaproteobacteria bacterium]